MTSERVPPCCDHSRAWCMCPKHPCSWLHPFGTEPGEPERDPTKTYGDDPCFGCAWPGCTQHPATGGGPIFRTSPMGGPFRGVCQEHRHLAEYVEEAAGSPLQPDDLSPSTPEQRAWFDANRYPGPKPRRSPDEPA